jgi:copper resistance protein C
MSIRTSRVGPDAYVSERAARTRRFSLALFAGLVSALLLEPTVALGHAELDTVSPADGSSVETPPSEIVMTFTEPLDPTKSSIRLVNTNSKVVAEGSTVDASDPKTMRLALPDLPIGTYTARWTSSSALDGDLDHGTTSFTTGAIGPIPGTPLPGAGSAGPSIAPSVAPASVAPSPSAPPSSSTGSTSDAIIPIVVALIVLAALGAWLLRSRARVR